MDEWTLTYVILVAKDEYPTQIRQPKVATRRLAFWISPSRLFLGTCTRVTAILNIGTCTSGSSRERPRMPGGDGDERRWELAPQPQTAWEIYGRKPNLITGPVQVLLA